MDNKIKIGTLAPAIKIANPLKNAEELINSIEKAESENIDLLLTPALSITGVSCGDLFFQKILLQKVKEAICLILESTKNMHITFVIGAPIEVDNKLYSASIIINGGEIIGIVPKILLSYSEQRWFKSGDSLIGQTFEFLGNNYEFNTNIFKLNENFTYAICTKVDEIELINVGLNKINLILNPSSDYDLVSRTEKTRKQIFKLCNSNSVSYVIAMPGITESSTDNVYSGYSLIVNNTNDYSIGQTYSFESQFNSLFVDYEYSQAEKNEEKELSSSEKQSKKEYSKLPFIPGSKEQIDSRCEEVLKMQSYALARRIMHVGIVKTVLGLSGGSDSALALIVVSRAYDILKIDKKNIITITMPGFGTTNRTYENSLKLAKKYNTTLKEISIKDSCLLHFHDIGLSKDDRSVAYENAQARERTQILMDTANMENALVVGTGDMSESALGWCTFNGDHISMYNVNCNIPKTMVHYIIHYEAEKTNNEALFDIIKTPISPELLPPDDKGNIAQKTESAIGPYILHDYFLYHFIKYKTMPKDLFENACKAFADEYSEEDIDKWLNVFFKRFMTNQFKRNCVPDGPKIGSIGLSPRGDFSMPSDIDGSIWRI